MFTQEYISELLYRNRDPLPDPPKETPAGNRNSDASKRTVLPGEFVLLEMRLPITPKTFIEVTYPSGYTEGSPTPEGGSADHRHIPYHKLRNLLSSIGATNEDFMSHVESTLCGFYECVVFPHEGVVRNVCEAGEKDGSAAVPIDVSGGSMMLPVA